eukprot:9868809-Heterocapsa_arctica.AAC.1
MRLLEPGAMSPVLGLTEPGAEPPPKKSRASGAAAEISSSGSSDSSEHEHVAQHQRTLDRRSRHRL